MQRAWRGEESRGREEGIDRNGGEGGGGGWAVVPFRPTQDPFGGSKTPQAQPPDAGADAARAGGPRPAQRVRKRTSTRPSTQVLTHLPRPFHLPSTCLPTPVRGPVSTSTSTHEAHEHSRARLTSDHEADDERFTYSHKGFELSHSTHEHERARARARARVPSHPRAQARAQGVRRAWKGRGRGVEGAWKGSEALSHALRPVAQLCSFAPSRAPCAPSACCLPALRARARAGVKPSREHASTRARASRTRAAARPLAFSGSVAGTAPRASAPACLARAPASREHLREPARMGRRLLDRMT